MFLLDCEDLYSSYLEMNTKQMINKVSSYLENDHQSKFLNCELFWGNLDLNSTTSIKDTQQVIKETIESSKEEDIDFFTERRIIVYRNRSISLALMERGDSYLEEAFSILVDLNMKEAENNISQQNLAVVSMLLNKTNETQYIVNRVVESDSVS